VKTEKVKVARSKAKGVVESVAVRELVEIVKSPSVMSQSKKNS
jgi:hypothetical protein